MEEQTWQDTQARQSSQRSQFCFGTFAIGQFAVGRVAAVGQFTVAPLAIGQFSIAVLTLAQLGLAGWGIFQAAAVFGSGWGQSIFRLAELIF